mmetsp:Transcript_31623/g.97746  ORF Transcript_31623/g.97746 Transcript_31623/m.97746 type:complete len:328 (-) Transcript_31623:212-1195(-)
MPEKSKLARRNTTPAHDPDLSGAELREDEENESDAPLLKANWTATLIAGGLAGGASRTCVAPLERVKILFQVQGISAGQNTPRHQGVWASLRELVQRDGVRGLWRGNGLNCVRVVPSSAIQFGAYSLYKRVLFDADDSTHLAPSQLLVAGGLAGATSTAATYPIDLVRARRTVDFRGAVGPGLFGSWRQIVAAEGVRGLYRGILPSLCGIVPYIGIDFAVFDVLKRKCAARGVGVDSRGDVTPLAKVACGALAGVCGMTVAFPLDTVRRNLQVATLKVRHPETNLETTVAAAEREPCSLVLALLVARRGRRQQCNAAKIIRRLSSPL